MHNETTLSGKIISGVLALILLAVCSVVHATAYVPADGAMVVETLKKDARQRELQGLRKVVAANPGDVAIVCSLARRYIAEARNTGDPR